MISIKEVLDSFEFQDSLKIERNYIPFQHEYIHRFWSPSGQLVYGLSNSTEIQWTCWMDIDEIIRRLNEKGL